MTTQDTVIFTQEDIKNLPNSAFSDTNVPLQDMFNLGLRVIYSDATFMTITVVTVVFTTMILVLVNYFNTKGRR